MTELMILGLIVVVFAALDIAALRWGVDSRPGFPDPRKPAGILAIR